jgi:hypothetical protein
MGKGGAGGWGGGGALWRSSWVSLGIAVGASEDEAKCRLSRDVGDPIVEVVVVVVTIKRCSQRINVRNEESKKGV